jgi:hypothetical protein
MDSAQQGDTLLAMFPLILAHARTPEQVAFTHAYIRDLSLPFCRLVEAEPALARKFVLIACKETIKLGRVKYDKEAPFLPPQCLGHVDVQELTGRSSRHWRRVVTWPGLRKRTILSPRFARKEKLRIVGWEPRERIDEKGEGEKGRI